MSEPRDVDLSAWMHVYGQFMWHGEARIVGTRSALEGLRAAIDAALKDGKGETGEVFASDGEGYVVEVYRADLIAHLGHPEYRVEAEYSAARQAAHRDNTFRRALKRKTEDGTWSPLTPTDSDPKSP